MSDVPGRRTRLVLLWAKLAALLAIVALMSPFVLEIALGVVTSTIAAGCDSKRFRGGHPWVAPMQREAQAACRTRTTGEAATIDLAAVLETPWERVYFVEPYQRRLSTVQRVGLHWHALACTRSHAYDEWSQMIFTDGGDVVAYFDIPTHGLFQFSVISRGGRGYGREAAVLKVACPDAGALSGAPPAL